MIPALWGRPPVFILGGGPSLTAEVLARAKGLPTIAVNSALSVAPWASVLFFNDRPWFEKRIEQVRAFGGLVFTRSREAAEALPGRVRRISTVIANEFPPVGSGVVRKGNSSGQTAIALAIAMGAKRVILLGFDMQEVDGRTHFHDEYTERRADVYEKIFIPAFAGWNDGAKRLGVTILNATAGSALTEFPIVSLDEVLDG